MIGWQRIGEVNELQENGNSSLGLQAEEQGHQ